ncbi:MAG: Xaa-Pro peptidase family protein [Cryobacterium sp.]|nr:Xaa-Pro peptidase family protein [Cryobacterium sp.]
MRIDREEYLSRQRAFQSELREIGCDGAIVVSRGGGTFDRHADVMYLTGHYQSYPYLPASPPLWSGRAHAALVISADGPAILCVSAMEVEVDVCCDDVRHSGDFLATLIGAVRDLGLSGRVGLCGGDTLPWDLGTALFSELQELDVMPADELLGTLRRIKSPAELDAVRRSAQVGRQAMTALLSAVRPGTRESDVVAAAVEVAVASGAGLYYATCSSGPHIGSFTSQALPGYSTRVLQSGELMRVDLVTVLDGYLCDFGRTITVGEPTREQAQLIDRAHQGIDAVIEALRPGRTIADAVSAGDQTLEDHGVAVDGDAEEPRIFSAYPPHWGHGLGLGWERPWLVGDEEMEIQPGMVIAVERALTSKGIGVALAEQNVIVTSSGAELLTAGPEGPWT